VVDECGEPIGCDCCDTEDCPVTTRELSLAKRIVLNSVSDASGRERVTESVNLCEICDSTYLTHLIQFPDQFTHSEHKIMKTIAIIGNMILKEIRNQIGTRL